MSKPGACYDCGLPYVSDAWIDAVVPDRVWDKIRPTAATGEGGLLCIGCMARRCVVLGLHDIPVYLGSGPFRGVDHSERDAKGLGYGLEKCCE